MTLQTQLKFTGEDDEAENEIDIIATKGYNVLIIECKAQITLI